MMIDTGSKSRSATGTETESSNETGGETLTMTSSSEMKASLANTDSTTNSKEHFFVETEGTQFTNEDSEDQGHIVDNTQEEDDEDGADTGKAPPANAGEGAITATQSEQKLKKRTRMRHHTLRLGINAVFF